MTRIYRHDYRPPAFLIEDVELRFDLALPTTRVRAEFTAVRAGLDAHLVLNGEGIELIELRLDGVVLTPDRFELSATCLTILNPPPRARVTVVTDVTLGANMQGLVHTDGVFTTYCEPEGFRRITYFPDRPDVLACYSCEIVAEALQYPRLLSNGNLVTQGTLPGGRHFVRWVDPVPKASYLFAIAAGDLREIGDHFVTRSGRRVRLAVHAKAAELPFCAHGLANLKRAMRWDEETFGREYDLDVLNIAVVRSYPGGAMEHKGLNIYATEFFLSSPRISTDKQIFRAAATVGHEYFHNWSGNRVGCRSWFELTVKEGLTVLRQQLFMEALAGAAEARIDDVIRLREIQYREDDGELAHAVRPQSYLSVNNLYTRTVYDKGAELIRMLSLLLGEAAFNAGIRAYFDRHDGSATTVDALMEVMQQVGGRDLTQFAAWYEMIGPVHLRVTEAYEAESRRYELTLEQYGSAPVSQSVGPLHIPVRVALLGADGGTLPLHVDAEIAAPGDVPEPAHEIIVELREAKQTFTFQQVPERPVVSLCRGHSAPVRIERVLDVDALALLARHDADAVSRWDAAQQLAALAILDSPRRDCARDRWVHLFAAILDAGIDPAISGRILQLPSERQLGHRQATIDVDGLRAARRALGRSVAEHLRAHLRAVYDDLQTAAARVEAVGARRLRNVCLEYLMCAPEHDDIARCWQQFRTSDSMENIGAALVLLVDLGGAARHDALREAFERFENVGPLVDQWFAVQAASIADDCADMVAGLTRHPAYCLDNATRVKALFDTFTANQGGFHHRGGRGYEVVAEVVRALDVANPRLAARFLKPFAEYRRFGVDRQKKMLDVCARLRRDARISPDVDDMLSRILSSGAGTREADMPSTDARRASERGANA